MNDYQVNSWFPVPIYATILSNYNKTNLISELDYLPTNPKDPSYFGDIVNIEQIHNRKFFTWLNNYVKEHTRLYLNHLGVSKNSNIVVQKSWSVVLNKGGFVKRHNHPNSHFSCVFYPKTPGGKIKFFRDYHPLKNIPLEYDKQSIYNHEYCEYQPQDGMMLIFPSTLEHSVEEYTGDEKRYSITYDLMITSDSPKENILLDQKYWLTL
jgi:uncharacterized protein (TIGR02466 family)